MAEIVGIVASGVSIAQIAGQVASSVIKIKTFWDRVKVAPDEINHLLREVESFSLILQHIQDDFSRNPLPELLFNNDCMRQSLELCKTGAAELESLASDLTAKLEGKSGVKMKMSAARIVLKKDDIQSSRRKLKSAIRLLSLAYQCHTSAMIRLQPEIILARLSAIMAASTDRRIVEADCQPTSTEDQTVQTANSDSTNLVTQYYTHWTRSPSWLKFLFGSLEYKKRNIRRRGRENELREARYKLPQLFSSKTWDFTYCTSLSDWSVNIRTYRTLTQEEPIFVAIEKGDILRIQSLLSSKKAFITDRDLDGNTLLHCAVYRGNLDICKLLLTQGADVCLPNYYQRTPLECHSVVLEPYDFNRQTQIIHEVTRLLVEAGAFNGLYDEMSVFDRFDGGISTFQYLQRQTCGPYYDFPLSERMDIAYNISYCNFVEADLIRLALSPSQIDEEMATLVGGDGDTLLRTATSRFARMWYEYFSDFRSEFMEKWVERWHILIREIVCAGGCLHAINDYGHSILYDIISTLFDNFPRKNLRRTLSLTSEFIKLWLFDLQEAGINLMQYGADEHALHDSGEVDNVYYYDCWFCEGFEISLINFSYGPRPEDWTLWFSEPTDFFAGEFWRMTERIKNEEVGLTMPGAWIDTS